MLEHLLPPLPFFTFACPTGMSKHMCENDVTTAQFPLSLMEAFATRQFAELEGPARRTAIEEDLRQTELQLQNNLKMFKLLEERIVLLKRFLSDA